MSFSLSDIKENSKIHFIGIGGISMSGLAEIMLKKGYKISGSDRSESHITEYLKKDGAEIFIGQSAENVKGADLVVYTAAIKSDNPELKAAFNLGIKTLTRAEFLGAITKEFHNVVCVAGTHGKTTTTSILAHAMLKSHADATISIGGELDLIGGNIYVGTDDYFLTEACEYTNSFLNFFPTVAVITNIEEDHLDFFKDLDDIKKSFRKFANLTKNKGCVIACGDDENVIDTLKDSSLNVIYYGLDNSFDYYAENLKIVKGYPEFDCYKNGAFLIHIKMSVPGLHNVKNAIASIAVSDYLGLDIKVSASGIEEFHGTHRRFEIKGKLNGATIIDDYAHHPTEIKSTLDAVKDFEYKKLYCVFQPHTYSRTRTLWNDFVNCFKNVDELILAPIYAARELPDGVTTSKKLADAIKETGVNVRYIETFPEIEEILKTELSENDIAFTMGAGNVVEISDNLTK